MTNETLTQEYSEAGASCPYEDWLEAQLLWARIYQEFVESNAGDLMAFHRWRRLKTEAVLSEKRTPTQTEIDNEGLHCPECDAPPGPDCPNCGPKPSSEKREGQTP